MSSLKLNWGPAQLEYGMWRSVGVDPQLPVKDDAAFRRELAQMQSLTRGSWYETTEADQRGITGSTIRDGFCCDK